MIQAIKTNERIRYDKILGKLWMTNKRYFVTHCQYGVDKMISKKKRKLERS